MSPFLSQRTRVRKGSSTACQRCNGSSSTGQCRRKLASIRAKIRRPRFWDRRLSAAGGKGFTSGARPRDGKIRMRGNRPGVGGAMRRSVVVAKFLAASFAVLVATNGSASAEVLINIDKSSQHLSVAVEGSVLHTWLVSTGRRGYGTPSGAFRPELLARR